MSALRRSLVCTEAFQASVVVVLIALLTRLNLVVLQGMTELFARRRTQRTSVVGSSRFVVNGPTG